MRASLRRFDVVAIGGGTGGMTVAKLARAGGASVALVDRERLGGDCLYTGCVPTKTMVASAKLFHDIKRAEQFGIRVAGAELDFPRFMRRNDEVIAQIGEEDSPAVFADLGVHVIFGHARFHSAHELQVGEEVIEAEKFVLATGSSPVLPKALAPAEPLSNIDLLELAELPRSMIVAGGGPIGSEFAQIFQRLGCQVTQVHPGRHILPKEDPELALPLAKILAGEGVTFEAEAKVSRAWREDGQVKAELSNGKTLAAARLLVAAGRSPNVDMALEKAGVSYDGKGVKVNAELRTTAPNIWACGDVIGSYLFTHVADDHARTVAQNLAGKHNKWNDRVVPWATFTDPELARVGLTEDEARQKFGSKVKVLRWPFSRIDRALCEGEPEGLAKVIVSSVGLGGHIGGGQIVGVHILGARAGELLHEFLPIMRSRLPVGLVARPVHVYPTLSLGVRSVVGQMFVSDLS